MATHHISAIIDGLLDRPDSFLSDLFEMDGKKARLQLFYLKSKGHKYIPSKGCKNFDPLKGCKCGEDPLKNAKATATVLRSTQNRLPENNTHYNDTNNNIT